MTIMLCKELSAFSKEFTTCLTTAGVRATPQLLGVRCTLLITALGSSPQSAVCVFTFICAVFPRDLIFWVSVPHIVAAELSDAYWHRVGVRICAGSTKGGKRK